MLNKVQIIGNLGADPEIRYAPSGDAIASLRIATTERWKDKEGNQQEATEWHRVTFWGRIAEVCGKYLHKGDTIYVEGKIQTRKWTDDAGTEKYSTEVRGAEMKMLKTKGGEVPNQGNTDHGKAKANAYQQQKDGTTSTGVSDDEIPF